MNIRHDKDREKRCGVPEVVFGENKSIDDLLEASASFLVDCGRIVITRISDKKTDALLSSIDKKKYQVMHNARGRVLVIKQKNLKTKPIGTVAVLTAGTSDIPVAEEAAAVAEELGCRVVREYDVGIAGIHRVFSALERLKTASVFIVVAGMEGALPSVVAGLVKQPVIAVPTSVGYGTGAGGLAALNTMLNSCTPLAVVNVDNGYGAAVLACKIIKTK